MNGDAFSGVHQRMVMLSQRSYDTANEVTWVVQQLCVFTLFKSDFDLNSPSSSQLLRPVHQFYFFLTE